MRWLGNKTPLLDEILLAAKRAGFRGGTVCDLFAGSGSVGRFFRASGYRVVSTDLMHCSLAFQKVYLECPGPPSFSGVQDHWESMEPMEAKRVHDASPADPEAWLPFLKLIRYLEQELPAREGILVRQFSPAGSAERGYLTPVNAARLDAIIDQIRQWRIDDRLQENEMWLLIVSVIDAADRVANISGTYGAYLKSWQQNSLNDLKLRIPATVEGPIGQANRCEAGEWIEQVDCDLLYLDPPYNHRQYGANYHLPEVISRLPMEDSDDSLELQLYGKTGLLPWKDVSSPLCSRRGTDCRDAMQSIIQRAQARGIVLSYSEEGILSRTEILQMLQSWSPAGDRDQMLHEIPYRRFRSDRGGASRQFRPAEGRTEDEVHEWLFAIEREQGGLC
ncbi:MAG: hypothetical protein HN891_08490 [Planctomycetes bacterium]|nr:hypothetical protein [Planctomycetota bacterium]MBT7104306.1 hypothetical protein [Planctomycetota bacterium]MBT7130731.1 hypothetical protein [Planctomycetota bacterium]